MSLDYVKEFLIKNGFEDITNYCYKKGVTVIDLNISDRYEYYTIISPEGTVTSPNLNMYWLIGYLTYYDIIDKNYLK